MISLNSNLSNAGFTGSSRRPIHVPAKTECSPTNRSDEETAATQPVEEKEEKQNGDFIIQVGIRASTVRMLARLGLAEATAFFAVHWDVKGGGIECGGVTF